MTFTVGAARVDITPGAPAHNGGPESAAYTSWDFDRILACLREARERARPARFGAGAGNAAINVNREAYAGGEPLSSYCLYESCLPALESQVQILRTLVASCPRRASPSSCGSPGRPSATRCGCWSAMA